MTQPPPEGPTPPDEPAPPGPPVASSPAPPPYPRYPAAPPPGARHGYPAGPDASWYEPGATRTMAGWALGLTIVPCLFPVSTLVGVGLAITVLVRSRDGRRHGKGLAIAALGVAVAWVGVVVVVIALGVIDTVTADPERDDDGQVRSRGDQSVLKIRPGDCFDYPGLLDSADGETVDTVVVRGMPCSQAHEFEAYLRFGLPDGDYPDLDELQQLAAERCFAGFKEYVGIGYQRSKLEPYFLLPSSTSWKVLDDRYVTCMLTEPGVRATGTFEGSRR